MGWRGNAVEAKWSISFCQRKRVKVMRNGGGGGPSVRVAVVKKDRKGEADCRVQKQRDDREWGHGGEQTLRPE